MYEAIRPGVGFHTDCLRLSNFPVALCASALRFRIGESRTSARPYAEQLNKRSYLITSIIK